MRTRNKHNISVARGNRALATDVHNASTALTSDAAVSTPAAATASSTAGTKTASTAPAPGQGGSSRRRPGGGGAGIERPSRQDLNRRREITKDAHGWQDDGLHVAYEMFSSPRRRMLACAHRRSTGNEHPDLPLSPLANAEAWQLLSLRRIESVAMPAVDGGGAVPMDDTQ